jgi:outer membrane lipoprotein-sorting protein
MSRLRACALAFLLLMGVVACATYPPPPEPASRPLPATSPESILAAFDRRWQLTEDLRALARVSILSAQGRYSTRQTFLWRRPALLRLDTVSLFGQPIMTLVADLAQASIYSPQDGTFFQGTATAATLARFIRLPLDPEAVAPLLMGYIRPSPGQRVAAIDLQTDEGMYLLRFLGPAGDLIQDAWVDPDQLLPRRVLRYTPRNVPAINITYSDFRPLTETVPFPHTLVIWLPRVETEVRIQFLTVDLNPGLSPAVFHLSPPEGARIVPLE